MPFAEKYIKANALQLLQVKKNGLDSFSRNMKLQTSNMRKYKMNILEIFCQIILVLIGCYTIITIQYLQIYVKMSDLYDLRMIMKVIIHQQVIRSFLLSNIRFDASNIFVHFECKKLQLHIRDLHNQPFLISYRDIIMCKWQINELIKTP